MSVAFKLTNNKKIIKKKTVKKAKTRLNIGEINPLQNISTSCLIFLIKLEEEFFHKIQIFF